MRVGSAWYGPYGTRSALGIISLQCAGQLAELKIPERSFGSGGGVPHDRPLDANATIRSRTTMSSNRNGRNEFWLQAEDVGVRGSTA